MIIYRKIQKNPSGVLKKSSFYVKTRTTGQELI